MTDDVLIFSVFRSQSVIVAIWPSSCSFFHKRLLFSRKRTFKTNDLDSVSMSAFGHKQTFA